VDADIRKAGKSSEIHIYPGVDHAFFNDERPDAYDRAAAEDAWRRTLTFFRQHLR
jgi:carboxymethylenebutenolidase